MHFACDRPLDHPFPHDEFNSARKVSPLNRATMMTGLVRLRRIAAASAMAIVAGVSSAAAANDASGWDGDARSAVRLIAASTSLPATEPIRAGLEIRLRPGWHTYWRYPGDAGVPPRFDFGRSQNVKSVTVLWPAPRRIAEQGLNVIGYTESVILPLVVVPENGAIPAVLHVNLEYAVCEKLCVPAEGSAQLLLAGGPSTQNIALTAAEARVPKRRPLGEGTMLAIAAVRREAGSSRQRVSVEVVAPSWVSVDLFAEGPNPDWALPVPMPAGATAPGTQRFTFDLDGAPAGSTYEDAVLTLTAVAGDHAIEVVTRLD
jgi:DsbC/DsbD-like thiol-disulfide interchange protein